MERGPFGLEPAVAAPRNPDDALAASFYAQRAQEIQAGRPGSSLSAPPLASRQEAAVPPASGYSQLVIPTRSPSSPWKALGQAGWAQLTAAREAVAGNVEDVRRAARGLHSVMIAPTPPRAPSIQLPSAGITGSGSGAAVGSGGTGSGSGSGQGEAVSRSAAISTAAWRLARALDSGPIAAAVARMLLAAYFLNLVAEQVEVWWRLAGTVPHKRWASDPDPVFPFPVLWVAFVLPAALLVVLGIKVAWSGTVLLAAAVAQDAWLTWRQLVNVVAHGSLPTELVAKRLGVTGATLLMVLAHAQLSSRSAQRVRSYAGLLAGVDSDEEDEEGEQPGGSSSSNPAAARGQPGGAGRRAKLVGHRASAGLLLGRLLITLLLVYVGWMQSRRIVARDWALWHPGVMMMTGREGQTVSVPAMHHYGMPDGHDNNWLLLELALALPFALGLKTRITSRLLSLVLLAEALTSWAFWMPHAWPSWHYRAHVRLHFFTNLALMGGLTLLQRLGGAGRYTVDAFFEKKQA
ncbi:hypothetical protein V8C86DRAFT_2823294 [Haematococcus lacustris]